MVIVDPDAHDCTGWQGSVACSNLRYQHRTWLAETETKPSLSLRRSRCGTATSALVVSTQVTLLTVMYQRPPRPHPDQDQSLPVLKTDAKACTAKSVGRHWPCSRPTVGGVPKCAAMCDCETRGYIAERDALSLSLGRWCLDAAIVCSRYFNAVVQLAATST